jgi:predicted nuclease of restriction endonuclease-like (RecB) superfamily
MIQFCQVFPDREKVSTLSAQLGWSHFVEIMPLGDELKFRFYAEMCRIERWSVRTLREKIDGMLFERTAIAKKPEKLIDLELRNLEKSDQVSADMVFRDPYFLAFLQLTDPFSEKDLEEAVIREMEKFILELGAGFSFVERQKRMVIDGDDYYLDLLFYNRVLNRLVAIDLKLGKFRASDKGQMELYLRWLEKYEMRKNEKAPVGLILCAGKSDEHVELLQLTKTGIRVATYMTELPSKEVLEKTLHRAIVKARMALGARAGKGISRYHGNVR